MFLGVYTTRVLTPIHLYVTRGEIKWRLGWIEARKMPIGEETARFNGRYQSGYWAGLINQLPRVRFPPFQPYGEQ